MRPSRRLSLLLLLLGGAVALAFWATKRATSIRPAWVAKIAEKTRTTRPNILLVVYDARRRDDFSFGPFGNRRGDTPFLSAFKEDAVYFEDAVAPGTWTIPVHASMFSGLGVCELGIDHYNPGFAAFDPRVLSLAEVLGLAGYQTVAFPDHPFFFNRNPRLSLIRGFDLFDVVVEYSHYASVTNIGTPGGATERIERLKGLREPSLEELREAIRRFNRGQNTLDLAQADFDPVNGVHLARLPEMFRQSPYFETRYRKSLDDQVFQGTPGRPFFLFLNLHMATIARPDPGLFARWYLRTLMLNAQALGRRLDEGAEDAHVLDVLDANFTALGLGHAPIPEVRWYVKQVFDNRFYDACFQAVWEHLQARGLTRNTVTLVVSDHGLSFGERGERFHLHEGARPSEYLTRVPLVLRFPPESGRTALHGRHRERVSLTDVFSTVVDLALGPGVFEREQPVRGRSLIERLERGEFEPVLVSESALLPAGYDESPNVVAYAKAVYEGNMKLVYAPTTYRLEGFWPNDVRLGDERPHPGTPLPAYRRLAEPLLMLYDLAKDPSESHNLAAEQPDLVKRMVGQLAGRWSCHSRFESGQAASWEGDELEALRALGYVQ
jgi:arylsulfatase A-like enzyme